MNLPCYEKAKELGYDLYCHSGDRTSATYMKDGISLSIWENEEDKYEATLEAIVKMVHLKIGPISFPHPNFRIFENQIFNVKYEADNFYS